MEDYEIDYEAIRSEEEEIRQAELEEQNFKQEKILADNKKKTVKKVEKLEKGNDYSKFIVNIQGKDYMTVAGRLKMFWDSHPEGSITTELTIEGSRIVFKASVHAGGTLEATGHASEVIGDSPVNRDSAIENCETSAVGRALGNLGIGLIGAGGIASAEEVQKAVSKQATDKQKNLIRKLASEQGKPVPDQDWFDNLTMSMARASIDKLMNNDKTINYGQN